MPSPGDELDGEVGVSQGVISSGENCKVSALEVSTAFTFPKAE